MKNLILLVILVGLVIPFISADVIVPGQKNIPIENVITNIADFPDYTFVLVCGSKTENQSLYGIYSYEIIGPNGEIKPYYSKPCNENSVYAFKGIDFSSKNKTELLNYINLGKGIKVLEGIQTTEYSTIADSRTQITQEYTISLNSLATNPSSTKVSRGFLIYLYYMIPSLAILILVYILIRINKNK
jgi:hypothetical protein